MDREAFYATGTGADSDYEAYLKTGTLLSCQKRPFELCHSEEMVFQIVHQVQELWMKAIGHTLLDIDDLIRSERTLRALTLFRRVHMLQSRLIDGLAVLETVSPKDYQEIRQHLGNGSGQDSPGFRRLLRMSPCLWESFASSYLERRGLNVGTIYDAEYRHDDAYMLAEALVEYDELFQRFRFHHLQLIERTLGKSARSLKGVPSHFSRRACGTAFSPNYGKYVVE